MYGVNVVRVSAWPESMLNLYFRKPKRQSRWIHGDQYLRNFAASVIGTIQPRPIGGVERVFLNLCKGLDQIGISYRVNQSFDTISSSDKVGILGLGRASLEGYTLDNQIVAGISLMTHPAEWPDLCEQYPIRTYLQHSEWAADLYRPYFGNKVDLWAAGIDTQTWKPPPRQQKKSWDVLLYNKVRWNHDKVDAELVQPIRNAMIEAGASFVELKAGSYRSDDYLRLLHACKSMVFVCEHESQGLACQEAMATGLPIFAWDQGFCLDPNYLIWEGGRPVPATSVPFFDERCGDRFSDAADFVRKFHNFLLSVRHGEYMPRSYILEYLTLESSAKHFLEFFPC